MFEDDAEFKKELKRAKEKPIEEQKKLWEEMNEQEMIADLYRRLECLEKNRSLEQKNKEV